MRRIRKYALGVFVVAALALPLSAAPATRNDRIGNLLTKLKTFIGRAFDYSGMSIPPG